MSNKLRDGIEAGTTDLTLPVELRTASNSLETTGKIHSDVTGSYWRQGGTRTAITMATLAAVDSAHSDGGFKEVDATNMPGVYRLDVPDAAFAAGADWVTISVKVTGCFVQNFMFPLTTNAIQTGDAFARIGAPAGASLAADVATVDTVVDSILVDTAVIGAAGAGLTAVPWNAAWDTEVQSEVADALAVYDPPTAAEMDARTLLAADYATATALATVDTVVDAILVDTAEIGAAGAGLTAVPWNAAWDAEVQSEVQDAIEVNHLDHLLAVDYDPAAKPGTATALLNELIESDAGISRLTANALEQAPSGGGGGGDATAANQLTIIGYLDTEIAAIKAKTDNLPADPAGQSATTAATIASVGQLIADALDGA
jgi:Rieske Fe-S protein